MPHCQFYMERTGKSTISSRITVESCREALSIAKIKSCSCKTFEIPNDEPDRTGFTNNFTWKERGRWNNSRCSGFDGDSCYRMWFIIFTLDYRICRLQRNSIFCGAATKKNGNFLLLIHYEILLFLYFLHCMEVKLLPKVKTNQQLSVSLYL